MENVVVVDFFSALREGVEAKEDVDRCMEAIRDVLDLASRNIQASGLPGFSLQVRPVMRTCKGRERKARFGVGSLDGAPDVEVDHDGLFAVIGACQQELCTWSQSQFGFPVRLKYPGEEVACLDAQGLQAALLELFATPHVGRRITALVSDAGLSLGEKKRAASGGA